MEETQQQTEEEKFKEWQTQFNRAFAGLKRVIKSACQERGLATIEHELEYLREHPATKLPREIIDHQNTVICYETAISEYRQELLEK